MLIKLMLTNTLHFTLLVFGALVFFAAGLLYIDAWKVEKTVKTPLLRGFGFLLLAIVSAFHATRLAVPWLIVGLQFLKITGLSLILISLIWEPVLLPPKKRIVLGVLPIIPAIFWSLVPISAILFLLIAATYLRKYIEGRERQLFPAVIAFFLLSISEWMSMSGYFANTPVVFWAKLFSEFGLIATIGHVLEFTGLLILGLWIYGYIRFQLQVQLFVITISLTLSIFLMTTAFYTFVLLRNLEQDALSHLQTDVSLLQYALNGLKDRTLAEAQAVSQNAQIKTALGKNDQKTLYTLGARVMDLQQTNTLIIASLTGDVVMRIENNERTNDSVSADPLFIEAAKGNELATATIEEGISYPNLSVKAAVPLKDDTTGKVIGVVITGFTIDNAFVDGVKAVTGLDAAVFGKDKRAATTFLAPDGKSRFVGTAETNPDVISRVLGKGETYIGAAEVLNLPFYTAYAPIKTTDNTIIGMLFVGKPQTTLTAAAERSIRVTFLGSILLMSVSLIPVYFVSRFLKEQIEA